MKNKCLKYLFIFAVLTAFLLSACGNDRALSDTATQTSESTGDISPSDNLSDSEASDSTSGVDSGGDTEESEEKVLATDFEVTLISGETVKLSDFQGKKVLLNFWATWCGPCVQEMPAFQRLYEEYPDDFVILAVNCGDSEADVRDFAEENDYTFNIAIDEDLAASSLYPTYSIPLTLIVDEEGYIVYGSYGASDADTMYEHYKEELGL